MSPPSRRLRRRSIHAPQPPQLRPQPPRVSPSSSRRPSARTPALATAHGARCAGPSLRGLWWRKTTRLPRQRRPSPLPRQGPASASVGALTQRAGNSRNRPGRGRRAARTGGGRVCGVVVTDGGMTTCGVARSANAPRQSDCAWPRRSVRWRHWSGADKRCWKVRWCSAEHDCPESERRLDTGRRGGAQVMSALRGGNDDVQRARALDEFVIITIHGKGRQAASRGGEELGSVLCHVRHALQRREPACGTFAAVHGCQWYSATYRDALAPRRCSRAAS
jgi:hypothetical protein